MKITFFSIAMSIIWGSALMLVFSALRKKRQLIDICSITGIVILYVFIAIRMLVPIELPWVYVIPAEVVYNPVYTWIRYALPGGITVWQVLLAIWIVGTCVVLLRLLSKRFRLWRWVKPIRDNAKSLAGKEYGISDRSKIDFFMTDSADVPMCVGLLRKIIIIPNRNYTENELKLIILHEATHIKNGDMRIQMLANLLCAIYWWNPAAYVFRKNLEHYFELRCDKNVTSGMSKEEAADYLEVLLRIYSDSSKKPEENAIGVFERYRIGGKELKERFEYLSSGYEGYRKTYIGKGMAVVAAVILLVMSYSFIFQSHYETTEDKFEDDGGGYEVTQDNSYLVRLPNGNYMIFTDEGDRREISKEAGEILIKDGFTVKNDDKEELQNEHSIK